MNGHPDKFVFVPSDFKFLAGEKRALTKTEKRIWIKLTENEKGIGDGLGVRKK